MEANPHVFGLKDLIFLRLNILKKLIPAKVIYRFSASLAKSQWHFFFCEIENSKIHTESQGTLKNQNNFKKNKDDSSNIKTHYKATVIILM